MDYGVIIQIANLLFEFYYYGIIVYIFSSWLPNIQDTKIIKWLGAIIEPYLEIFRKIIPPIGMLDISAIFALIVFHFIHQFALYGLITVFQYLS